MSILIKGMEMPENCWDCPLQYDYMCCSVMDEIKLTDENEKKRDRNCPLEEVTETHDKRTETHACDYISRDDAIAVAGKYFESDGCNGSDVAMDIQSDLLGLPSAQPDLQQSCNQLATDCNTHNTLGALDCIGRKAAIAEISRFAGYLDDDMIMRIQMGLNRLKRLPSAQPDIIACGDCKHWINHDRRCGFWNHGVRIIDWCSRAERKEDDARNL